MSEPDTLPGQPCPMCKKKTLTLMESNLEIPFFGKACVFSMNCSSCKYHMADVEAIEKHDPVKYTIEIESEEDLKIRVVKSSTATVKIPHITTVEPGATSIGYISNIEGILNRVKRAVEQARDGAEDQSDKKKAKNMLKKLQKVMWGQEKLKIIIEDPNGNSAIISEKAVKSKLK